MVSLFTITFRKRFYPQQPKISINSTCSLPDEQYVHVIYGGMIHDTRCSWSHFNSHNQVRGHRTGSSHSGAEEYPREKHKQTKGGTRIYHS